MNQIKPKATDQQVEDFLGLYGGDTMAAVYGIRDYAFNKRKSAQALTKEQAPPKGEVLLDVQNVTKVYKVGRQKVSALNGVNIQIHKGEFVALTGASGSGKSTLLQLMGGLDKPSSGQVFVSGSDISKMSDSRLSTFRGQTIGFVFQFFYLQPFLRLRQNLEVPGMFSRIKRSDRRQYITELAEAVGLSDRLHHYPKELSGGQMQRAAIARALLNKPQVILADEPTGNLDSQNSAAIIELFEKIRRDYGTTIVMVTHDQEIARRADREIKIKDGVVIWSGQATLLR